MVTRSGSETEASAPSSEWDYASVGEIAQALQSRKLSASELFQHTIARIEVLDKRAISVARPPVGVQVIGPYLEDRTTIAFAVLVAREFGGFVPPLMSSL